MFNYFSVKGGVCAPKGFFAGGTHCGLRPGGGNDLAFIRSETPCDVAAVFTENRFAAAPIHHAKARIGKKSQGVLINAKNANAMTGPEGIADIEDLLEGVSFDNPLMSSTGVIGVRLNKEKIAAGIKQLDFNAKDPDGAAKGIMTTDRWDKQIAYEVELEDGKSFSIGAMAKGAGMIQPSMATMLCFITTDAAVGREAMQEHLAACLDESFNAISVDGDMSTNDTVFLFANGESGAYDTVAFREVLKLVMHHLALEMVKDGEGATRLCAFEVKNAASPDEAKKAARALSNSLLVKTALFGCDPNWGRLASTIGASAVTCDYNTLEIKVGEVSIFKHGANLMTPEVEEKAAKVLAKEQYRITCDLGVGDAAFTAYGCDLGYEYVKINADYRT